MKTMSEKVKTMKTLTKSMTMTQLLYKGFSGIFGLLLGYVLFHKRLPVEIRALIKFYSQKLINFLNPYIHLTFPEYTSDGFSRSYAFACIERYLNANSTSQAKNLKVSVARYIEPVIVILSMSKNEEVTDEYEGIKLWWTCHQTPATPNHQQQPSRFFQLTCHRRHRGTVTTEYVTHVITQGKAIILNERQRRLFTNNKYDSKSRDHSPWSHVPFNHPATFDTLAMDPEKKQDIIDDLLRFAASKDYYAKIGKAWKRGYLLYGPPGTGKSTMIAAMGNLLKYDIYDIELTSVKDNTELRKLLIDTSNRSIIVIEDIDCSLDLTGQRNSKKHKSDDKEKEAKEKKEAVTLSGLLNFIDGLWSACGGERIIVFTTNYVEKLDPALIRRGRMDKHIELSYCGFEAFKVLAKNYLDIEDHELFGTVRQLLEETGMTPADVAENLMPTLGGGKEVVGESCLKRLIRALEEVKEQARIKAEEVKEQARIKAEEEEKLEAENLAKKEEKKKEENDQASGDEANPKTKKKKKKENDQLV